MVANLVRPEWRLMFDRLTCKLPTRPTYLTALKRVTQVDVRAAIRTALKERRP